MKWTGFGPVTWPLDAAATAPDLEPDLDGRHDTDAMGIGELWLSAAVYNRNVIPTSHSAAGVAWFTPILTAVSSETLGDTE